MRLMVPLTYTPGRLYTTLGIPTMGDYIPPWGYPPWEACTLSHTQGGMYPCHTPREAYTRFIHQGGLYTRFIHQGGYYTPGRLREGGLLRRVVPVLHGEREVCCAEWCLFSLRWCTRVCQEVYLRWYNPGLLEGGPWWV